MTIETKEIDPGIMGLGVTDEMLLRAADSLALSEYPHDWEYAKYLREIVAISEKRECIVNSIVGDCAEILWKDPNFDIPRSVSEVMVRKILLRALNWQSS